MSSISSTFPSSVACRLSSDGAIWPTLHCSFSEQRRIETTFIFVFDRAGHQHVIVVLAPFNGKVAPRQRHGNLAAGAIEPRRRNGGGAGRRPASFGEPRAAFPGANDDVIAGANLRQRDVGTLREHGMILD